MRFVALDVETANADLASICALGLATFEDGTVASEWYSLINPEDRFDPMNVRIHGIDAESVAGAPRFEEAATVIAPRLAGAVVVSHMHFDRVALTRASLKAGLPSPDCTWLDTAMVTRRTWPDRSRAGYALADIAEHIGYRFQHHHALEDAKAAGHVLMAAMSASALDLEGMLRRVAQPIDPASSSRASVRREGNPDGPLFGEVAVFTGALEIPRREAANIAASLGCEVAASVTKKTTLLVVGDVDARKIAGHQLSSKHRKAEELIAKGQPLRIISESDFRELMALA